MSTRDIVSDLQAEFIMNQEIQDNVVTISVPFDISHFDDGIMVYMNMAHYLNGTFALKLQESDSFGGTYTDVPAEKLIEPDGPIVLTTFIPEGDLIPRIGAFSTKAFVRGVVTATNVTFGEGAHMVMYAIKKPELKPIAI